MIELGAAFFDIKSRTVFGIDNNRIALRPKSLDLLAVLASQLGETVGKDDLIAAVWRDINVTDDSLTRCVADIRKAICDEDRSILQTVPKVGYRLVSVTGSRSLSAETTAITFTPNQPAAAKRRFSIVVLPFVNRGIATESLYMADALTEDLTADLARISDSFVISRRTAATFSNHNRDPRDIARELNVGYVLDGAVSIAGQTFRVDVDLIDGRTGQSLWSDRFEKPVEAIHDFQGDITGRIARSLNLEIKEAEIRHVTGSKSVDPVASDLALRAWVEVWARPQDKASNDRALRYAAQALDLDPLNGEAHGVAAYAYARAATYGWGMTRETAIAAGRSAAEQALAQDPKNADALYGYGFLNYLDGKTSVSLEQMREVIALNRHHAPAYFFIGVNLVRQGYPQQAIVSIEQAFALSPRDPLRSVWYGMIGRAQVLLGQDADAIDTALKGIAANAAHAHNYSVLASGYAHLGQHDRARAALGEFLDRQPDITLDAYRRDIASDDPVSLKAYQRFVDGLRLAGLPT